MNGNSNEVIGGELNAITNPNGDDCIGGDTFFSQAQVMMLSIGGGGGSVNSGCSSSISSDDNAPCCQ